ncbi:MULTISPECIES: MFS transporter [unclassified Streptomyces]|uniref:MFS transporter n=1 Tax=unclassified Streptomyces TaxID=2593676 RepID=UPI00278C2033|nr:MULTISPECIES: MFS transporter [unclassified Streptomyces]
MSSARDGDVFRFDRRAWTRLLVLCTAVLFEGMSLSSINVQLAGIQEGLELRPDQLQLVAGAFLTTYAGLLLVGGTCADRWGRRRMFLSGVAVFGIGSLAATLAQEPVLLIGARAVQGVGAAVTAPAAVALIVAGFPEGAARNKALGVFSAMGAAGFSLGVVIGGLLTQGFGWRGAFFLYVPLATLVLALGPRVLAAGTPEAAGGAGRGGLMPWLPPLLITGGLVAVVYAVGRVGTGSGAEVTVVAAVGLAAIVVFLVTQARARVPLLPPALLADRRMLAACLALGGAFAGITGAMFLVATELQEKQGYSALLTGLAFLPQGLAVGLLSTPASRLANRAPVTRLLLAGLAVITVGQLLYTTVEQHAYVTHLLPAAILVGAGIAVAYPAATLLASAAADMSEQGTASGTLVTWQQAGGALGVAAVTAIDSSVTGDLWGGSYSLWGCFAFAFLTLCGCAALLLSPSRVRRGARDVEAGTAAPTGRTGRASSKPAK